MPGLTNGDSPSPKPLELAIPLPNTPGTRIHIHLTVLTTTILLFLSSASSHDTSTGPCAMGSFVYAMPDVSALPSPPSPHSILKTKKAKPPKYFNLNN